jgi:hypothetical protein
MINVDDDQPYRCCFFVWRTAVAHHRDRAGRGRLRGELGQRRLPRTRRSDRHQVTAGAGRGAIEQLLHGGNRTPLHDQSHRPTPRVRR